MNETKNNITFIGNAIVDILWQTSEEFLKDLNVQKGSMQLIDKEMVENFLEKIKNPTVISGGSAANTAVGYSSFGGNSYFIGQVGNDEYGDLFARNINKSGVFFENKETSSKDQTSKSIILVTPDAERSMSTFLGASVNFNVNSINGFLPEKLPLEKLPVKYSPLQEILDNMPSFFTISFCKWTTRMSFCRLRHYLFPTTVCFTINTTNTRYNIHLCRW